MGNLLLDRKYISLISSRLPGFVWKSPNLANARCILCGDSKSNPKRKRFFIYIKNGEWMCHCHNHPYHKPFHKFLRQIDDRLYQEYALELFADRTDHESDITQFKTEPPKVNCFKEFHKLKKISSLDFAHSAKIYIVHRMIPNPYHAEFRWCPQFMTWINTLLPKKFTEEALSYDEGRIVIPFYDTNKYLFAVQGRAINPKQKERYISILFDESYPLVWGLDRIDSNYDVWAFEGVMDALFIPNSIAFCGSNLTAVQKHVKNPIVVYDNEPRAKETKKKIEWAIDQGLRVVIWPDNMEHKDVNKMIQEGYSVAHIHYIMRQNLFDGLRAKFRLEEWSKR